MPATNNLGVQLYSVKDHLGASTPQTLERLAGIGYTHVEPYDIFTDAGALRAGLDSSGLAVVTAHVKVGPENRDSAVTAALALGIGTIIIPSVDRARFADRDSVTDLAAEVAATAAFAADRGIRLGYHNHDFEFRSVIDGVSGWRVFVDLLPDQVLLQLDTFWASMGGGDVFELLPAYADRIHYLHVKNEPLDPTDPPPLGPDITGRMYEVMTLAGAGVELAIVEVVTDGDVFALLQENYDYFQMAPSP